MSTFYIYPIDQKDHQFQHQHHHQQPTDEPGLSQLKTLSATGLSRILEIPLCLLENANSKDQQQQQQQVYWLTNAHLNNSSNSSMTPSHAASKDEASSMTATNELVTHSFANRKRSIVKRRKSVLSASFTAEDEAEAIRIDREQTLAALERGHRSEGERKEEKETQETVEQKEGIFEHDPSSINDGDLHDFELLAKPQEANRGNIGEEQEEQIIIPSKQVKLQQQEQQQQTEGANVVSPKDSAIDLRATALEQETKDKEQAHVDIAEDDSCTKVIDLSLVSSLSLSCAPPSSSSSVSSVSPSPAMTTTTLKKKSSWSPRRMFSASSKKSTIEDKQDKFNISSLFSRKSSSPPSKKINQNNSSQKSLKCTNTAKNDSCTSSKNAVPFNYTRLPIHTERAIYRLSHLKLTTPRRPLRDQVIISNLMFWYLSIVSTNSTNTENEPAPMEHLAMTKKACRMQQQQIQHKKRRMRNQVRPENSNAMDIITKQPKKPHQYRLHGNKKMATRPYSNNSSSEDDDDDGDDTDTDSDDNSDSFSFTSSNSSSSMSEDAEQTDEKKKTRKYSIFSNKKKDKKWLPSFSKGNNRQQQQQQQQLPPDDEDDIPLAMYQKK
ncbi:hypothetical protein HMPREF1544_06461 [Mucor circinelloides 1006PhL]|uniref:Protein Zds1 C-terminal domain-containing protein n=1 Tax=Mucor circinelloides f. circinelloides (strain 1006PhL) TaxID=1220926 RepID=S2JVE7_MUCC1|nr:hypothetical protein HMPREF1544_06461 [Mucor circinelloides 1006PhL]